MRIELTALAWEARVLPLYDARVECDSTGFYVVFVAVVGFYLKAVM